ncbi:transporter substrate-binding domain-containing protein [Hahella sp. CR1]|uniref:substrate-binding periplasmic protein n=1 Tax=Hahella sp. CR1 TaxID=2992807 RepID=UPI0024414BD9|nr:transporter substrate-binding domain-containing protein [Hahella sp. CR1]MDG9669296.1 transporter substrate-binding domain-containing protein [Hahella sp. CR1]
MLTKTHTTIFLLATLLSLSTSGADNTVTLTNGEWTPYTSETLKHGGVFTHIVTEAFALSGYKAEYQYHPWKRSYQLAQEGKADGSMAWAPTPDRRRDFIFSDPVTHNKKVIFHLKSFDFDWRGIDDLIGLRIGATDSYTYGEAFDDAARDGLLSVEYVASDKLNIRKLLAGRIQIFPMEIEVGYSLINQELSPIQTLLITNHHRPILETPFCVVISRKISPLRAEQILQALNSGLEGLRSSGRYEEMLWQSRIGKYRVKSNSVSPGETIKVPRLTNSGGPLTGRMAAAL